MLRQTIDDLRRDAMRFGVPPRTRGLIAQAECAAQVDNPRTRVEHRRGQLHGNLGRGGEKDHRDFPVSHCIRRT